MKKLDDLEAQKDELKVRQAQEKTNLNNKIRARKKHEKKEKEKNAKNKERAHIPLSKLKLSLCP